MLNNTTPCPHFILDKDYQTDYPKLEDSLSKRAIKGQFPSFDGLTINYEYFLSKDAKANIVIVHGLSEFIKKYYEVVNFFLCQNFNVFIYDQRGHGYSGRQVEDFGLIHVNHFSEYVKDLDWFINKVVLAENSLPLYIYSHSMGGAITALYLQENHEKVDKAIFSSPMVCPYMHGAPKFFIKNIVNKDGKKNGFDTPFRFSQRFKPNASFKLSSDLSYQRFLTNLNTRINDNHYQNSQITNRWIEQALSVENLILKEKINKKIKTPTLILSAENDKIVLIKPQITFAKMLKNSTFVTIPNAKHTIFTGTDSVMSVYFDTIAKFISD